MLTLIIELLILGHVAALFRIEMGAGVNSDDQELLDQFITRFGGGAIFDPTNTTANEALRKIVTLTFVVASYFLIVPFSIYMVFRSAAPPSHETSFMRFFMLYAYSMAIFIPVAGLYTVLIDFARAQWLLLLLSFAFATYFLFKETIEVSKRTLTFDAYRRTAAAVALSTALFCLLLRYYFIAI
jgi:hypothetical protein